MNKNLRFSGFLKPWQEDEFHDFFKVLPTKEKVKSSDYLIEGQNPIVDQGKDFISGYSNSNNVLNDFPYIVFGDHTRCTKWVDFPFLPGADGVKLFKANKGIDDKFAFYTLQNTRIENLGYSRHMRELNKKTFPRPSDLLEQQKIASCLSTWDAAIEAVEEQIALATKKKKALMQKLLTGEVRLPGFDGEWENHKLGSIGDFSSAGVDKKIIDGENSVRLLNFLDVYNNDFVLDHNLNHYVSASLNKSKSCNVKNGDLFITPSSETREDICHTAIALNEFKDVVYSYHLIRYRSNIGIDNIFKSFMLKTDDFKRQVYKLCNGSGQRYFISMKDLEKVTIRIPASVREQSEIGSTMLSLNDNVSQLTKRMEVLKQQKKSLMQQLLG